MEHEKAHAAAVVGLLTFQIIHTHTFFLSLDRLIKHTKQLLEENEERLCIKVLQTLREMMTKDRGYGEKVHASMFLSIMDFL